MKLPSREEAHALLAAAEKRNPGAWILHSLQTARAAELLAAHHPRLDTEKAYLVGLLHDIGRRDGVMDLRHCITGYRFLHELGYEEIARICLTHGFPIPDTGTVGDNWDGTAEELTFIAQYLDGISYDEYDYLTMLCDTFSLSDGYCLMDKRLLDVAMRRGVNAYSVEKWRVYFAIRQEFETAIGQSIYQLLPGVVEATFGCTPTVKEEG